jgi:hypothetical protein
MPNTTNFNWATPADTDLVKDGAAAIRTLGSSIDTSFVDLKGGTTGQVLSKASNTDLDYSWVTTDDANAIQNAIVDAKGDLIAASANDTPARLAVGNNGETLVADSAATVGLRYSATPSASNPILNGAYDIWQRGTSFSLAASTSAANGFSADRWQTTTGANQACTLSRQSTGDSTNLPNIQYCLRYQRNSGQTGTGFLPLAQSLETVNAIPYAGKTITLSFYARAGANYSSASSAFTVKIDSGTGTDQNILTGYTGGASPINTSVTLTTTWQRFSATGTIAATAAEFGIYLGFTPVGTASTNDYYEITGVQIDIGSVALPFRRAMNTIQGELAACQRYYYRVGGQAVYQSFGLGYAKSTTVVAFPVPNPVTMRTIPSSVEFSTLICFDGNGFTGAVSAVTLDGPTSNNPRVNATVTGATQFRPYELLTNNSTSGFIGINAEL